MARECVANLLQPLQNRLHAGALLRRQGHAGILERLHHVLLELAVDSVGGSGALKPRGDLLVLEHLRAELAYPEQTGLARTARPAVGRHAGARVDWPLRLVDPAPQSRPR